MARREAHAALERERAVLMPQFQAEFKAAVQGLAVALDAAAEANAKLTDIVERAQAALGHRAASVVDSDLTWNELSPETARMSTRIATWRRRAQAFGIG